MASKKTMPIIPEAKIEDSLYGLTKANVHHPSYWQKACKDLMRRDRIMKKLIPLFSQVHLISQGQPFITLARSIVGQQISVKAADAIWLRLSATLQPFNPQVLIAANAADIKACGLSNRKVEYLIDLAKHFIMDSIHTRDWAIMENEEIINELIQIKGVGRWTAEMFLIFNLLRPNVLPLDDIGLLKAISINYFSGEPVTRSEAREVAGNWQPWCTVATWYLWRSLDPVLVEY